MNRFALLFALLFAAQVAAQTPESIRCGNEAIFHKNILRDTALASRLKQNDEAIQRFLSEHGNMERHTLSIPVVVHVVWHTEAENICDHDVFSQIEALNRDFSGENADISTIPTEFKTVLAGGVGLRFCLATEDAEGRTTTGVVRVRTSEQAIGLTDKLYFDSTGGSTAWNPDRYLNIWVANTSDFIGGFGTYPDLTPPERSGLVINPRFFGISASGRYNMGRTAVHELGHYLGLYHPWNDDSDCTTDDGVDDTPPQQHAYTGCPQYPQFSCGYSNTFMNYMDYVDDRCMMMFTQIQKEKMLAALALFRPGLTASNFHCSPNVSEQQPIFRVYPNPSDGVFMLEPLRQRHQDYTVAVLNSMGQLVRETRCVKSNGKGMEMDLSGSPTGTYFLFFTSSKTEQVSYRISILR